MVPTDFGTVARNRVLKESSDEVEQMIDAARGFVDGNRQIDHLSIFDLGTGEGTFIDELVANLKKGGVPIRLVVQEKSSELLLEALPKLCLQLYDYPMTITMTNIPAREAPQLTCNSDKVVWHEIPLHGNSASEFSADFDDRVTPLIRKHWDLTDRSTHPKRVVFNIYNKRYQRELAPVVPDRCLSTERSYDIIVVANSTSTRKHPVDTVKGILEPMASTLAEGGRLLVFRKSNHGSYMDMIGGIWPGERPCLTTKSVLLRELAAELDKRSTKFKLHSPEDDIDCRVRGREVGGEVTASEVMMALSIAATIADIDEARLEQCLRDGGYFDLIKRVLQRNGREITYSLQFFVVERMK